MNTAGHLSVFVQHKGNIAFLCHDFNKLWIILETEQQHSCGCRRLIASTIGRFAIATHATSNDGKCFFFSRSTHAADLGSCRC